jgi:hypothetical protein
MNRDSWKMTEVVEKFTEPSKYSGRPVHRERLKCGHVISDRDVIYGNELSVRVHIAWRIISGKPVKRRCYECAQTPKEI